MEAFIQGFVLKKLYLLTSFNGAWSSHIEFALSKKDSMERFTFSWLRWSIPDHSLSK